MEVFGELEYLKIKRPKLGVGPWYIICVTPRSLHLNLFRNNNNNNKKKKKGGLCQREVSDFLVVLLASARILIPSGKYSANSD